MSLLIRQKIFTLTDTYEVCDHTGKPRYAVNTEFLTLGHHIHITDLSTGRETSRIDERIFTFLHKADLHVMGEDILMTREFTFFMPRYTLSNGWEIKGDFLGLDYEIRDARGETAARISKEIFHLGDTYLLEAVRPANELLGMTIAIAVDMMNCGGS